MKGRHKFIVKEKRDHAALMPIPPTRRRRLRRVCGRFRRKKCQQGRSHLGLGDSRQGTESEGLRARQPGTPPRAGAGKRKGRCQFGAALKSREETPKGHPKDNLCCAAAKVKPPIKFSRRPHFPAGRRTPGSAPEPKKEKAAAIAAQPSLGGRKPRELGEAKYGPI